MFGWFKKKPKELRDYLKETKTVIVNGVIFEIKRIDAISFAQGYDAITTSYDLIENKKKSDPSKPKEKEKKLLDFFRNVITSSVVRPRLTMDHKDTDPTKIHVDEVVKDPSLRDGLVSEIFKYSKKNKK
jgi:hypothetical protein